MPTQRLQTRYRTPNDDVWEEWFVRYDSDEYATGGYDEVLQVKRNGREMGHTTWHYDGNGHLLAKNDHGDTTIPGDAVET